MSEFKIGDRVRLNRDFGFFKAGEEFEVVPISDIHPGLWLEKDKVGLHEGKLWGDYDVKYFAYAFDIVEKEAVCNTANPFQVGDKVFWSDIEYANRVFPNTAEKVMTVTGFDIYDKEWIIARTDKGEEVAAFSNRFKKVEEKAERQIQFVIQEGNIEAAARFIVGHNKYMSDKTVNYFIADIKKTIKRMVDKIKAGGEAWYSGTAGYTVIILQEDKDYYVVEVHVDPAVSEDGEFVNVEEVI